ncbi:uncharacterized protein SPAPADRAFT_61874 [Spathaspora passalidarum NRRL Y-27907]|uniref:GOLD domain-containing protein n=1 Tax=Spathaspora passalidarum (strain NRRL Y-27907 / 11-Y1) TaxID=619300 RepID=G3ARI1_SPAPN|nr:uncharacterized protein SPAPADRAFT_61874 [Spathaspora passalidarum NRRL Y-27907]EGW31302.1 hypothetical protein SPAPADRAFT_61874 [Spathaspora passalidarum NRRL Y-27907]
MDLHKDTILIGRYKMEITTDATNAGDSYTSYSYHTPLDKKEIGVVIDVEEVFDNNHRVVRQRGFAVGQFSFNTLDSGQHRICLTPKSFLRQAWFRNNVDSYIVKDSKFAMARIGIELAIGDTTLLDSKRSRDVQTIKEQVYGLNNKLSLIRREQLFIREKEAHFRDLSERTCETVVNWVMIQLGAMVILFIYQAIRISKIFEKRKID